MAVVKGCCDFCGRPRNDIMLGPLHRNRDVKCHYYCLLFSSSLGQNGKDEEGILGFLLPDIRKELKRTEKMICSYCNKPGAVSKCYVAKCRRRFHLPCGMERGSLHLFFDDFRSYCGVHRRKQKVPADILNSRDVMCSICFEQIEDLSSHDSIWAPCCKKNGWFHRLCLQKFALSAAYFFKCPLCASQRKFRDAMLRNGIYIPDQDASWELEPNAFAELLERHHHCDAAVCKCPKGRKFGSDVSRLWNLILCQNCGSKGIHIGCVPGPRSSWARRSTWSCNDCQLVIRDQKHSQEVENFPSCKHSSEYGDEEDEDDEEIIVVDDEPEDSSDRAFTNFTLPSPNIRKILSNVIQLTSSDLIEIVDDDNEMMEIVVSDDEDPFTMDEKVKFCDLSYSGTQSDEPTIYELNEGNSSGVATNQSSPILLESSSTLRHEVERQPPFSVTKSPRILCKEMSPNKHRREYFRRKDRLGGNKNGNSKAAFAYYGTKGIFSSKCTSYSSHYVGLRSDTMRRRTISCQNKKICLKCKKLNEVNVGRIYNHLLVDGWSEISSHPFLSSLTANKKCDREMWKLYWLHTARWICGAASCLISLKHANIERNHEFCLNPLKIKSSQNVNFSDEGEVRSKLMLDHETYGTALRELLIGFLY